MVTWCKDTVDSAPFHSGTGGNGRDGEHSQEDHKVAHDHHQNGLPVARLGCVHVEGWGDNEPTVCRGGHNMQLSWAVLSFNYVL